MSSRTSWLYLGKIASSYCRAPSSRHRLKTSNWSTARRAPSYRPQVLMDGSSVYCSEEPHHSQARCVTVLGGKDLLLKMLCSQVISEKERKPTKPRCA